MLMFIFESVVRNAYIILFMYLFRFFFIDIKLLLKPEPVSAFQDLVNSLVKNISNLGTLFFFS